MQITLRPANDADLPFLLELRFQTMDEHYIASGVHLSQEEHMQRVLHHFDSAEIIMVDGQASGLLKVDRNGTDWHLIQIQLIPELQRRGLGTQLMGQVISEASSTGASLRLGVLKVNPAHRLYERLGFLVVGETSDSIKMRLPSK
jgi:GNAT superfamily N-acetyltransferase